MEYKSIITDDMEHCYICGAPYPQMHHCMNASNKKHSEEYGLIVPLCLTHHTGMFGVHQDPERMLEMRKIGQRKFEETHSREDFIRIFGKNYL